MTPPDGHETKYLKDYEYEADRENSHATNSFQSIDRIITQSQLDETKVKPLFVDEQMFDDSKSLFIELDKEEKQMNSDVSSIGLLDKIETPGEGTKADLSEILKQAEEEEEKPLPE